jgi:hypothetical protein
MSARDHLVLARRFLVLSALMFWLGGFTFYAGVVVPIGQDVVGKGTQPFITRLVTYAINAAGAVTLLALVLDLAAATDESRWARRLRWLLWLGMAATLVVLVWLHPQIDRFLDVESQEIMNRKALRPWHRAYLWVSTGQWACGVLYVWLTLRAWRAADRALPEVPSHASPSHGAADR